MKKTLYPRDEVNGLYVSRKKWGKGLTSIDILTWRIEDFINKEPRKSNYSDKKQHKQHKDQQNNYNLDKKMGRKTNVWIFQATNKRNLTLEALETAKKRETLREKMNFFKWQH